MSDKYVIEHRRVLDGDWVAVQTVGEDILDEMVAQVDAYNEASGVGDWRVRPLAGGVPVRSAEGGVIVLFEPPSRWERLRFWWLMRTSRRAR